MQAAKAVICIFCLKKNIQQCSVLLKAMLLVCVTKLLGGLNTLLQIAVTTSATIKLEKNIANASQTITTKIPSTQKRLSGLLGVQVNITEATEIAPKYWNQSLEVIRYAIPPPNNLINFNKLIPKIAGLITSGH